MKTKHLLAPGLLILATGCSAAVGERQALAPDPSAQPHDGTVASASPAEPGACQIAGDARVIAHNVRVRGALELTASKDKLTLQFSTSPSESLAVDLDPSSGAALRGIARQPTSPAARQEPVALESGDGAPLPGAPTATAATPDRAFVVGTANDQVVWAPDALSEPRALWPLPSGSIHELRATAFGEGRLAIVFRQDDTLWVGTVSAQGAPDAPLLKIAQRWRLRSPTLAVSKGRMLVAWAEQKQDGDRWSLAGTSLRLDAPADARPIAFPVGGPDSDAIAPAVTGTEAGRFMLVWTEGPSWGRQVRALTLSSGGDPLGKAMLVSSAMNAGWGRPAVTGNGRGAIVFLANEEGGFAVMATPIACPMQNAEGSAATARK